MEHVVQKAVHDGHGLLGYTRVRVNVLQNLWRTNMSWSYHGSAEIWSSTIDRRSKNKAYTNTYNRRFLVPCRCKWNRSLFWRTFVFSWILTYYSSLVPWSSFFPPFWCSGRRTERREIFAAALTRIVYLFINFLIVYDLSGSGFVSLRYNYYPGTKARRLKSFSYFSLSR